MKLLYEEFNLFKPSANVIAKYLKDLEAQKWNQYIKSFPEKYNKNI